MTPSAIKDEVALFADVATELRIDVGATGFVMELMQSGEKVLLNFSDHLGKQFVTELRAGEATRFTNYRSLLASTRYGNVQNLARLQSGLLRERFEGARFLEIQGEIANGDVKSGINVDLADNALSRLSESGLRILLLDGPAGIGKTHLIERLVYRRALGYRPGNRPPILHVQSRGRVMTWLPDRIASTLQEFRSLHLTYEQLPVLVRHGLVQVAIDGFDELADPSGYEQSWASLRAFVDSCTGEGAIILAGRDTFLGVERLRKALIRFDERSLTVARLRSVEPQIARNWLSERGWDSEKLRVADDWGLFDENSYVLRPYFLAQLAQLTPTPDDFAEFNQYPLAFLVELFVEREAEKLAGVIELTVPISEVKSAVWRFYLEVARTMADYETDVLDLSTLQLMAIVAFEPALRGDDLQRIKNRVESIALLEKSDEMSRKFAHSEIENFFLAESLIDVIGKAEIPKSIIRNVFGTDILRTFAFTITAAANESARAFLEHASRLIRERSGSDRAARNLAGLYIAASPVANLIPEATLLSVSLDDAVIEGVAAPLRLQFVSINQLDARGANLQSLIFRECQIGNLIADETTLLPETFPTPAFAEVVERGKQLPLFDEARINEWVLRHKPAPSSLDGVAQLKEIDHPLLWLLERVCRVMLRQYWIRSLEQDRAGRLVARPEWSALEKLLDRHQLLRKESRAASGTVSDFFHIKRAPEILAKRLDDPQVASFWRDIIGTVSSSP